MSNLKRVWEHSQHHGVTALSTAELFALTLYGSGAVSAKQREKALQMIQHFLAERNDTAAVLSADIHELLASAFDDRLAYRLMALLELHRRLARPIEQGYQIRTPADAARLVLPEMSYLKVEHMRILVLDRKNHVVWNQVIYQGTVDSNVLRAAEVYRPALVRNCPSILVCHNHPSGDPTPSPEDIATTKQLVQAGELLEIEVIDHLVIGAGTYTSLKDLLRW